MQTSLRAAAIALILSLLSPIVIADDCVDCHRKETRNIVNDWQISRHHSGPGAQLQDSAAGQSSENLPALV